VLLSGIDLPWMLTFLDIFLCFLYPIEGQSSIAKRSNLLQVLLFPGMFFEASLFFLH